MEHNHDNCICDISEVHEDVLKKVRAEMPEDEKLFDLAELFKVFGDSTRMKILFVLFEAEVCTCDLADMLSMTPSAISHQLSGLKKAKLVQGNLLLVRSDKIRHNFSRLARTIMRLGSDANYFENK